MAEAQTQSFYNSPLFQSLLAGGFGFLSDLGKGKQEKQNLAEQQRQFNVSQQPTGWAQNFAGNQMLKAALLGRLQAGPALAPGNPNIAARMGSGTANGPLQLTPDWLSANASNSPYGVSSTTQALADRRNALGTAIQQSGNPAAASGAGGGIASKLMQGAGLAGLGGFSLPGLGMLGGPLGLGAMGAVGLGKVIAGRFSNQTKGNREDFAKSAGFPSLAAFNEYLSTLGPEGQALRAYGENVVGKHNKQQEAEWIQRAQALMSGAQGGW